MALIVALTSTIICPAQEGESTKEGVAVVEEIVSDNGADNNVNSSSPVTHHTSNSWSVTYTNDTINSENVEKILESTIEKFFGIESMDTMFNTISSGLILLTVLMIGLPFIFIILIIVILYFIYKGRRAKYDAYKSMAESGQTIPEEELRKMSESIIDRSMFNKGIKNICLGVGLAIFLGIWMGNFGIGIGVLITCIGIGELLVDYFSKK